MKKTIWISFLTGCSFCLALPAAQAQEFEEHISKEFTLQKPATATVVAVYNLAGSVKVEGYAGDKVMVEAEKKVTAHNEKDLQQGKQEVQLKFEQQGDSILVYLDKPFETRPHRGWHHNDEDGRRDYRFEIQITVKVPYNVNLAASTINNGDVAVANVTGKLNINNINGAISIANAKGTTDAHTINGNLTVTYAAIPPEASSYYTLNGKLEVTYPAALSADVQLKTMNGQFYTDFPNAELLPARVIKTQQKTGNGTIFKIDKNSELRIGNGGKVFKFETLNGNIYIKKQS